MKVYGLRSKFRYNYRNCHPRRRKGEMNWWEDELNDMKSKKTARQQAKKFIKSVTQ